MSAPPPHRGLLRRASDDARFAARAAAFSAYTGVCLADLELATRGLDEARAEEVTAAKMRAYGRGLCRIFGVELRTTDLGASGFVAGRDADGRGRLFLVNHRSGLDVPITLVCLEGKHLSRADLAGWPIIGHAARRVGTVFVDRSNRKSGAAAIQTMVGTIESGRSIVIFPEGTTFSGDEVRPFKPGAMTVARRTGCEIVPVGLAYHGEHTSFGSEGFAVHMRRVLSHPTTRVGLAVGTPLRLAPDDDLAARTEQARDLVRAAVVEARALAST